MRPLFRVAAITGISGWIGGVLTEKWRNSNGFFLRPVEAAGSFGIGGGGEKGSGVVPISPGKDVPDSNQIWDANAKQNRVSQIMRFGFPGMDNIRSFENFVLSYDRRNRVPNWVFEHLNRYTVKYNSEIDRSKCDFFEDVSVHPFFRASNKDYKGSGYDRGHLAAAGNHRLAQHHVEETFVLSNMAPQVGVGFNRDSWNSLEKHVRSLTKTYDNVYVCTGPLYLPRREPNGRNYVRYEVIGQNNVAVPTHFFKIAVCEQAGGHLDVEAYIMPNQPIDNKTPLNAFMVPLEAIERAAGLLFLDRIPRTSFRLINGRKPTY